MSSSGPKELRIVFIGKTKNLTSKIENFLKENAVQEDFTMVLVKTLIQDSPSQVDETENTEVSKEMQKGTTASIFSPGPHVFLFVQDWENGIKTHDVERMKLVREFFGDESVRYFLPLITHEDKELKPKDRNTIMSFIETQLGCEKEKYSDINVYSDKVQDQVRKLVDKLREVAENNKWECYTEEMFKKAQEALCQKMQELERKGKKDDVNDTLTKIIELVTGGGELSKFLFQMHREVSDYFSKYTEKVAQKHKKWG